MGRVSSCVADRVKQNTQINVSALQTFSKCTRQRDSCDVTMVEKVSFGCGKYISLEGEACYLVFM